jgi:hypothetical protein
LAERQLADARAIETKHLQLATAEAAEGNVLDPADHAGDLPGELDAIEEVFAPTMEIDFVEATRPMVE